MASFRSLFISFDLGIRGTRCFHGSRIATRQVTVEGVPLNYEVTGRGEKVALCLPGALGTIQSDFGPQMKSLSGENLTLVCWDPPGYGKSCPPPRHYSLDFLHQDATLAALLMKKLGYDKYSLLGWSDGGNTSMILAATYPQQVDKLVIWGANSYVSDQDIKIYEGIRDINKWSKRMRAPLEATYGKEYFKEAWEGWVDAMLRIHCEKGGDICKNDLAKITCPTLIIHGAKDPLVPIYHPQFLIENIKDSQLVIMDEGKHNIHLKYAEEFNKMVSEFLEKE